MEVDQDPVSKYINKITAGYVNCYKRHRKGIERELEERELEGGG